jgi:hypothetical protein
MVNGSWFGRLAEAVVLLPAHNQELEHCIEDIPHDGGRD